LVDALDEFVLSVALERHELVPGVLCNSARAGLDDGERFRAVHGRFPGAEQIEVGAVK
jgi:hypothetical protein